MKLYLHDDGYRKEMFNGKDRVYDFKNVAVTDTEKFEDASHIIWVRVHRSTEEYDMSIVNQIASSK